jgi:hypothetical protein
MGVFLENGKTKTKKFLEIIPFTFQVSAPNNSYKQLENEKSKN